MAQHYGDTVSELERVIAEDPELRWRYEAEGIKLDLALALDGLRRERGWSQSRLAKLSGTTQPMLSRFFGGEDSRSPTIETLVKIADALGKRLRFELVDREAAPRPWVRAVAAERPELAWSGGTSSGRQGSAAVGSPSWHRPDRLPSVANPEAELH